MAKNTKRCPACHTKMTAGHASYTKCPANIAHNTPTVVNVPTFPSRSVTQSTDIATQSSISTALKIFNHNEHIINPNPNMTTEDIETMVNITEGLPKEQQREIFSNMYDNLPLQGQLALIKKLKQTSQNNDFLLDIAANDNTPKKILRELRKNPPKAFTPGYVVIAEQRSTFQQLRNRIIKM